MTISVAMCTYNGARFVREQLDSIAAQTRPPDELVIFDDASADETASIVSEFSLAASFPVLLSVNASNVGSTANFERALQAASGDIIFLADQDDIWAAHKIERVAARFEEEEDVGLIFSNAALIDENGRQLAGMLWDSTFSEEERAAVKSRSILDVLLWKNVVTGATSAFRSRIRDLALPIPNDIPHLIHDGWIALIAAATSAVRFIDEPLIDYRQHAGQQLGVGPSPDELPHKGTEAYIRTIGMLERELERLSIMRTMLSEHRVLGSAQPVESIESILARKRDPLEHYRMRNSLPASRIKRLPAVIAELARGRYHRHSRGTLSALKDLTVLEN
jgi:glycosyltransferase involved in cell wall biosynthesis